MPEQRTEYDALIVGGGPAGSLTAWQLARAGLRVALLEASAAIGRKVCGEYLAPSGVELLRKLGLEPWLARRFRPVLGMRLVAPSGRVVNTRFPARAWHVPWGFALNREAFDNTLLDLARQAGVALRMGFRVRALERVDGLWSVRSSEGETWHGRVLVGADGRKSTVARLLGLTVPDKPRRVALHCFLRPREAAGNLGEMHILPGGMYVGLNPVEAERVNCSLVCDAAQVKELGGPWAVLRHAFAQSKDLTARYHHPEPGTAIRSTYPITHRVRSAVAEGAALVGDAAGFIDPLTGEGINNALWMALRLSSELLDARAEGRLDDPQPYLIRYGRAKLRFFRHKTLLNRGFQGVIRNRALTEAMGWFLARNQARADSFIGIVGNVYGPLSGLLALLGTLVPRARVL